MLLHPVWYSWADSCSCIQLGAWLVLEPLSWHLTLQCLSLHSAVVRSLSHIWLFATPWTAAHQTSLSFTISWNLLKLMSIESMMPFNYLILCHPFLLRPSIFPNIRVFSNELVLLIRWPEYWSFSFSSSPSNKYSGLISFSIDCFDQFFGAQLSLWSNSHIHTWLWGKKNKQTTTTTTTTKNK